MLHTNNIEEYLCFMDVFNAVVSKMSIADSYTQQALLSIAPEQEIGDTVFRGLINLALKGVAYSGACASTLGCGACSSDSMRTGGVGRRTTAGTPVVFLSERHEQLN